MLHSWPTERPLLNSGCLSPHTALGKGMLASPRVLVQVSLLTVSLSPPLSQAEPFIFQESDAKNPSTVLPPGKPACFSFLSWRLALLTPSCPAEGIHCKTDVDRPWRVHSLGQLQLHLPPQEDEQEVKTLLWPKAINPNYTRFLFNLGLGIEFAMNYPFNWNPQFYCLHG